MKVEVVEPMGNELYVYFTLQEGGRQYVARLISDTVPPTGRPLEVWFDVSRAHFFDAQTEEAIQ